MDISPNPKIEAELETALFARVSQALESMTGAAPAVRRSDTPPPAAGSELETNSVVWQSIYSAHPDAIVSIFASTATWNGIGKHVLEAAGIEDLDEASVKSTFTETIGQGSSALWQDFSAISGSKWEMVSAGLASALPLEAWHLPVQITMDALSVVLHVFFSKQLLESLAKVEPAPKIAEQEVHEPNSPATSPFELLFDVELPVSVSFGRALVPLKEILKLNSGSIVELNRAVTEPVEVIINNCVIARGEVVVVEGNYGVRIQQIISRQDRLRSLN